MVLNRRHLASTVLVASLIGLAACGEKTEQGGGGDAAPAPGDSPTGDGWVAATGCAVIDGDSMTSGGDDNFPTACSRCHGTEDTSNIAPPRDRNNNTATTFQGVGAHQSHLRASDWRNQIRCEYCHEVPSDKDDPGHQDQGAPDAADLVFSGLARADGATPDYALQGGCSMVYCHGSTLLAGGANHDPQWTRVDSTQNTCRSCHDSGSSPQNLPGSHAPHILEHSLTCDDCHPDTNSDGSFKMPHLHIDGRPTFVCDNGVTFDGTRCTGTCHGGEHFLVPWIPTP